MKMLANNPREYIASKLNVMTPQKNIFTIQGTIPSESLFSSYKVAWRIVKISHIITKKLILPAAMDVWSIMIEGAAVKQL